MNIAAEIVAPTEETSIALLMETDPSIVLREPKKLEALYKRIDADIAAQVPDLTSDKGRKAVASLAFKIARTKTAVEGAAKTMTEEFRKATAEVNSTRNAIVEILEAKQKAARKPLTDWEKAEDERLLQVKEDIAAFKANAIIHIGMTAAELLERIEDLQAQPVEEAVFQDRYEEALDVKASSFATMTAAHQRMVQEEADRAELERFRLEQAERDRLAAIEAARIERERKAKAEAEADDARRVAAEKAEEERIAAAAKRAEENAKAEAERKAAADREALERKHAAELKAEQDKAAAAENAMRAKAELVAREEARKAEETKRLADEQAAREADQAHRAKVMSAAKKAIMTCGVDEEVAKKIVLSIEDGEIPAVSIRF